MSSARHGLPTFVGTCPTHGKKWWFSKKEAKKAARINHPGERLSVYRCSERDEYWHLGHLNPLVIQRGIDSGLDGRH